MAANKVKVELDKEGVRALLRSGEFLEACEAEAGKIAARAGDGFATNPYVGKNRVNVSVYPATAEAFRQTMKDNALVKAMNG